MSRPSDCGHCSLEESVTVEAKARDKDGKVVATTTHHICEDCAAEMLDKLAKALEEA